MLAICAAAMAQEYTKVDTVIYRPGAAMDSTLRGKSILNLMPTKAKGDKGEVKIHQSQAIATALGRQVMSNNKRTIQGYRVRIYFDNTQNARSASEQALGRFTAMNHVVSAYRSYQTPFFKVTAGDFRTRSEAIELLERLKYEFPSAFIVKETINYPPADRQHSFVADTISVIKPVL